VPGPQIDNLDSNIIEIHADGTTLPTSVFWSAEAPASRFRDCLALIRKGHQLRAIHIAGLDIAQAEPGRSD
jgi:hypothetical protein